MTQVRGETRSEITDPLKTVEARLQRATKGGYARLYADGKGNQLRTRLELTVAKILHFCDVEYSYRAALRLPDGSAVTPTFATATGAIFMAEDGSRRELLTLKKTVAAFRNAFPVMRALVVARAAKAHELGELAVPFVSLTPSEAALDLRSQAIFIDDPSFAFDYSHILPTTSKCSVLHGHTSAVLVEIVGRPVEGMIVDFGEAKRMVRECLQAMDHKLFISKRYVVAEDSSTYRIRFRSFHGFFDLKVPKATTFLLEGQATVENLADEVVKLILPKMPSNVEAVGAYVYEGLNKGSHLLALATHRRKKERGIRA